MLLEVSQLAKTFSGNQVLRNVSFNLEQGEAVGIIGPNGCGKTTLFNCLSGFLHADGGRIMLRGEEITRLAPNQRALRGIGRIFQNFGIFRELTLMENMLVALESRRPLAVNLFSFGSGSERLKESALSYLRKVGLDGRANDRASELSGGQMRLLEMVRAVAFGAELFLLDEPTAGVSPKMKEEVAALIRELRGAGKTVLIIEHDLRFIQGFCNRVLVLDGGSVALDGTPDDVRASSRLQEIYFGHLPTKD